MTDLVLVNPNCLTPAPFSAIEPPLWLGLIAGYQMVRKSVEIVDAEAEGLTTTETILRVNGLHPKEIIIVVMGANPSVSSTPKMPVVEELLKYLDAKLTGLHPIATKYPNTVIEPFPFSQAPRHPHQFPDPPFKSELPSVPWWLLPMARYRAHNWHCLDDLSRRTPYGVLYTSLNCPFKCSFCNVHSLYGDRQIRHRAYNDIYAELHYFAKNGIRNIKVWDELFSLEETKVLNICDYIIRMGFDFNIWAYARVDTVTEKMLVKMKKAGFNWLAYGFESAGEGVRNRARKRVADSVVKRAIEMTRDASINIIANFMFGLPGETEDDRNASLSLAIRENFEYVNFSVALPYPGSDWYNSLEEKPTDWSSFSQFSPNICADPKVVSFRDNAFQDYFSRPEYLSMIKGKFGEKAERHIKEMIKWKIR